MSPNKEQKERLREWLELADDMGDGPSDAVQGVAHRDGVLPVVLDVGEAYQRGKVACHLHVTLKIRGGDQDARYLCAKFHRAAVGSEAGDEDLPAHVLKGRVVDLERVRER